MATIDRFLPRFDLNEVHATMLDAPPERALEIALVGPFSGLTRCHWLAAIRRSRVGA